MCFPGWRWDFFCTRNDCAAQLQWWKPSQVGFMRGKLETDIVARRAPSERLLLGDWTSQRSYGTCTGAASNWTSFTEWVLIGGSVDEPMTSIIFCTGDGSDLLWCRYVVEEGDTLAGIALRYLASKSDEEHHMVWLVLKFSFLPLPGSTSQSKI